MRALQEVKRPRKLAPRLALSLAETERFGRIMLGHLRHVAIYAAIWQAAIGSQARHVVLGLNRLEPGRQIGRDRLAGILQYARQAHMERVPGARVALQKIGSSQRCEIALAGSVDEIRRLDLDELAAGDDRRADHAAICRRCAHDARVKEDFNPGVFRQKLPDDLQIFRIEELPEARAITIQLALEVLEDISQAVQRGEPFVNAARGRYSAEAVPLFNQ